MAYAVDKRGVVHVATTPAEAARKVAEANRSYK